MLLLYLHLALSFWYSLSQCMCVNFDPDAHVFNAFEFAFKLGRDMSPH
jgi:hypothetical protein